MSLDPEKATAATRAREEEKQQKMKGTIQHHETMTKKDQQLGIESDNINARLEVSAVQGAMRCAGGSWFGADACPFHVQNPLAGISHERLQEMGRAFAKEKGLGEWEEEFARGAMVAQDALAFEDLPLLDDDDRNILRREVTHK
jgi:hypothetical protein